MDDLLIQELEFHGPHTDIKTINEILKHKDEAFEYLADIATDSVYWKNEMDCSIWTPVCALHLLAKMGGYSAQLAINSALVEYHDDSSDWMVKEMPYIMAYMGPDAIPLLSLMLQASGVDRSVRNGMARALVMIAIKSPDTKRQVIQTIKDTAQKETDSSVRMMIVEPLADFVDPDLRQYLKDCLWTGFITDDVFDVKTLETIYDNKESMRHDVNPRDPLDIFSNSADNFYQNTNDTGPPEFKSKGSGRNKPCPCGSGKKYKKCCMSMG